MKRYSVLFVFLLVAVVLFSGCKAETPTEQSKEPSSTPSDAEEVPVLTVDQAVWEETFGEEGLLSLLENYTVTNSLAEGGRWETSVTPSRVSRLAKTDADELVAGAVLANGDEGVIQFTYGAETGWEQGVYDETDTVEQYVEGITNELKETLQVLFSEYENAAWDEARSCYVADVEIPYSGPSLVDPSEEKPTAMTFEVFFTDGALSKVNIIVNDSLSVVHSFGTTPVPELPSV